MRNQIHMYAERIPGVGRQNMCGSHEQNNGQIIASSTTRSRCYLLITICMITVLISQSSHLMDYGRMSVRVENVHVSRPTGYEAHSPLISTTTSRTITGLVTEASTNKSLKVILLWTGFFASPNWDLGFGHGPFQNHICNYSSCITTNNRSYVDTADVVVFHCRDTFTDWPSVRHPWQIYVVHCSESPEHSTLKKFNGRVNITSTYRLDSDIKTPVFYLNRKVNPGNNYTLAVPLIQRAKSVVWVVSNCQTASQREVYVRELKKYIPVDIYGRCGPYKCRQIVQCFKKYSKTYKFYLSFENSVCEDYVTEKLFNPMLHGEIIPVVLGGANYSRHVPDHSYIDVRDFNSPKHLAEYLQFLSENVREYNDYFKWKSSYDVVVSRRMKMFCELCEIAHQGTYQKSWADVDKWWREDKCDNSVVSRMKAHWTKFTH